MGEMVISTDPREAFQRARSDAILDTNENAHFASIGGLDKRASDDLMEVPEYIDPYCRRAYLEGYKRASEEMFGEGWRTVTFSWRHVLTVSGHGESTTLTVPPDQTPTPNRKPYEAPAIIAEEDIKS